MTGFTIWLSLAAISIAFNYVIHSVNPRDDED
jgi:hypothetical protein